MTCADNNNARRVVIGPDAVILRQWLQASHQSTVTTPHQTSSPSPSPGEEAVIAAIRQSVLTHSPFRCMERRRGAHSGAGGNNGHNNSGNRSSRAARMTVAMTNCGRYGWTSDAVHGYRYTAHDPLSLSEWPPIPPLLFSAAQLAADAAGFPHFSPDVCLVNAYAVGARLALHADKDEEDLEEAPIVSMSLGLPCTFLWGGGSAEKGIDSNSISEVRGTDGFGGISPSPSSSLANTTTTATPHAKAAAGSRSIQQFTLHSGDVVVWGGRSRLAQHGVMPILTARKDSAAYRLLGGQRWNLTFRLAKGIYRR